MRVKYYNLNRFRDTDTSDLGLEGKMLLLKSCPKCKGDLLLRNDFDGFFLSCIQCGYARDFKSTTAKKPTPEEVKTLAGSATG